MNCLLELTSEDYENLPKVIQKQLIDDIDSVKEFWGFEIVETYFKKKFERIRYLLLKDPSMLASTIEDLASLYAFATTFESLIFEKFQYVD